MFPNKIRQFKASFTLLELIVAIALIGIIMTLSTINYRRATSRTTMMMAAHQIAADARLMESYAASARQYGNATAPDNQWGIYFNTNNPGQYLLFVDRDEDAQFSGTNDAIWRTVKLPRTIKLKTLKFYDKTIPGWKPITGTSPKISVVYTPPSPSTTIMIDDNTGWTAKDEVKVVLTDDNLADGKEIYFNFFGLIDVVK